MLLLSNVILTSVLGTTLALVATGTRAVDLSFGCNSDLPYCDPLFGPHPPGCHLNDVKDLRTGLLITKFCSELCRKHVDTPNCVQTCVIPNLKTCQELCNNSNICSDSQGRLPCVSNFNCRICRDPSRCHYIGIMLYPEPVGSNTWIYITCGLVGLAFALICLVVCCARTSSKPVIVISRSRSLSGSKDDHVAPRYSFPGPMLGVIPPRNSPYNRALSYFGLAGDSKKAPEVMDNVHGAKRANVILELINSERDFVKHLKDVVEGYLHRARKHPEIFTAHRIKTIFANIEQLYEFQCKFLEDLEQCISWKEPANSQVGHCFLKYEKGFSVYHHYCNNHPNATSELQDLYSKPIFRAFFEECRLARNMIDISLDGFLLTPIQRICKYPLQLNELLKNTDENHPDYESVSNALVSMRNCANLANERKRRIEALADVMSFQEKVDNWFGPKLSDTSSILIHTGEVSKMTSHTWSQGVQLYLFDHLLLYSKKDILKRNSLVLKGRICMDTITEISDADEYKPGKSFKLYCSEQQKWFVFTTKSEKDKDDWIRAFERERNLVEADENEGFQITDRELAIARRTLQHRNRSRSARYRHKRPDTAVVDQLEVDDPNMMINRTLSLPSCIHPSHVMNFVEDSRVVTSGSNTNTGKKNSSPISNSRSPVASSQQLAEHPDNQTAPTNWLHKMGSRRLSKSQVYNINGQTGQNQTTGQHKSESAASNTGHSNLKSFSSNSGYSTNSMNGSSFNNDAAEIKYEELEKRHRDHMVSEEQARLYRLNNDLPPPPTLYHRSVTPTHLSHNHSTASSNQSSKQINPNKPKISPPHPQKPPKPQPPQRQQMSSLKAPSHLVNNDCTQSATESLKHKFNRHESELHPVVIVQGASEDRDDLAPIRSLSLKDDDHELANNRAANGTFEAELILSSGRVVRVREDAV